MDTRSSVHVSEGTVCLCCVEEINVYDIKVSLPGRRVGTVSIANVSKCYGKLLMGLAQNDDTFDHNLYGLDHMFSVGQQVVGKILKMKTSEKGHDAISVGLCPTMINEVYTAKAVREGMVLPVAVKSCEDHGYIMDMGIASVRAFLPHENTKKYIEMWGVGESGLCVGHVLQCLIVRVETGEDVVTVRLTANPDKVGAAVINNKMKLRVDTLLPGMRASVKVVKAENDGVKLRLLSWPAYITRDHLNEMPESYEKDSDFDARILYVDPMSKVIYVSARPFLLNFRVDKSLIYEVGLLSTAKVSLVTRKGAYATLKEGAKVYIPIKHCGDNVEHGYNPQTQLKVGSVHKCRVFQKHHLDGVHLCSFRTDVLERGKSLSMIKNKVGEQVRCRIRTVRDNGCTVQIGVITGFIHKEHMNAQTTYSTGQKLKCKILSVSEKNSVCLTANTQLVRSNLPVIKNFDDAKVGMSTLGMIIKITGHGLLLSFYGNVKGWATKNALGLESNQTIADCYHVGQVVTCYVQNKREKDSHIYISLVPLNQLKKRSIEDDESIPAKKSAPSDVKLPNAPLTVGQAVTGHVISVKQKKMKVKVRSRLYTVQLHHVSDYPNLAKALLQSYEHGDVVHGVVLAADIGDRRLTLKKSFYAHAQKQGYPQSFSDIKVNDVYPVCVEQIHKSGVFVKFPCGDSPRAFLVPKKCVTNPIPEDLESLHLLRYGTLLGKVYQIRKEKKLLTMTTLLEDLGSPGPEWLLGYLNEIQQLYKAKWQEDSQYASLIKYKVGDIVEGTVTNIADVGVIAELENGVTGLITSHHMNGLGVSNSDKVKGVVLYVDFKDHCVEMTLLPNLVSKVKKDITVKKGDTVTLHIVVVKDDFALGISESGEFIYVPVRKHFNDFIPKKNIYRVGESVSLSVCYTSADFAIASSPQTEESRSPQKRKKPTTKKPSKKIRLQGPSEVLTLNASGFNWDDDETHNNERIESSSEEDDDEQMPHKGSSKAVENRLLRDEEIKKLLALQDQPKSSEDFEALLEINRHDVELWKAYAISLIDGGDICKGREVIQKCIASLPQSNRQSQQIAWQFLLFVDSVFGNPSDYQHTLKEALCRFDTKEIYLYVGDILERNNKIEQAADAFTMLLKCDKTKETFSRVARFYFQNGFIAKARELLQQSIRHLTKKDQVYFLTQFALLEFQFGAPERAKTIFEKILASYPQRVDVLSVFVDALCKQNDIDSARLTLEKAASQNFRPQKMRAILVKYLNFEKAHGNEQTVKKVEDRARNYVQEKEDIAEKIKHA